MVTIHTATVSPTTEEPTNPGQYEFSLVSGGPTFQLLCKLHLAAIGMELLHRRMVLISLFAWMPLLILTIVTFRNAGLVSFLQDIEVHARFLVALPVLIAAELFAHSRIRSVVRTLISRRILLRGDLPQLQRAIDSAVRLRDSVSLELALLVLAYTVGLWVWNGRPAPGASTWYGMAGERWQLTPAGYWYVFGSIPIFQFLLLRWYLRMLIWFRFLWHVSRMDLNLFPTHPDRCSGLNFLGKSSYSFGPVLFAQGAVLAGIVATRVLCKGENLLTYKVQALGFVVLFVGALFVPLLMFSPKMAAAKRKALAEYGLLAQQYVEGFETKWVRSGTHKEELLGTSDIQSLADLANSYDILREIRTVPVPFGLKEIGVLCATAIAPLLPLLLTIFSPEELVTRIIKMVF